MSARSHAVLGFLLGLAVILSSSRVDAQFGRPVAPAAKPAAEPEPFSGRGKVQGVMPDMKGGFIVLVLLPDKNELWGLKITKSTKIRIKGKAEADFLRSGLNVQFNAMVDKKAAKLKDPVKKLTIFTESNEFTLGLFPDVGGPATAGGGEVTAGDFKPYVVAGRVSSAKSGDLVISVPSFTTKLHAELDPKADIDFNVAFNPGFVSNTDEIQATGTKAPLPSMGQGQGGYGGAGFGGGFGAGAAMQQHGRMMRGRMMPGAAGAAAGAAGGVAGAAGGAAAGAAGGAAGAAGGTAAGFGGGGGPTGTPCGLVNVAEASVFKTEKLSGASASHSRKPARSRKPAAEKAEKAEK
jgi:hypothetical protein